jgi:hypothetical protein
MLGALERFEAAAPTSHEAGFGLPFWSETVQATPYGLSIPRLEPLQSTSKPVYVILHPLPTFNA